MTEFCIYCTLTTLVFWFIFLLPVRMRKHQWHEVDSASVAKAARKSLTRK